MSRTRIHNLSISLDGFATGEPQSAEAPFGHAGERLHEWMFATRFWAKTAGNVGADHAFAACHEAGIGAEIMGANKFVPPGWQDDRDWKGWWRSEEHTSELQSLLRISYAVLFFHKKTNAYIHALDHTPSGVTLIHIYS